MSKYVNIMRNLCLVFLVSAFISGCSVANWQNNTNQKTPPVAVQQHKSNSLHAHVEKLARQLFSTSQTFDSTQNLAVGTILPSMPSSGEQLPEHAAIGLQIQESLMTFATQAGLKVIEYKTMPAIKIGESADTMLSRNVNDLTTDITADYFLTGTYTLQESNIIVNIRLIQVPQNIVLAAATDYVPNDAMWSQSKVTLKNNQIYRNAY